MNCEANYERSSALKIFSKTEFCHQCHCQNIFTFLNSIFEKQQQQSDTKCIVKGSTMCHFQFQNAKHFEMPIHVLKTNNIHVFDRE